MSISYEEAYGKLGASGYQTVDSLINLLKSVSGKVKDAPAGSTYLLYSGTMPDGAFASDIAKQGMASIRHTQTQASNQAASRILKTGGLKTKVQELQLLNP